MKQAKRAILLAFKLMPMVESQVEDFAITIVSR